MPELMPSFDSEPRSFRELPQELKRDLAATFLKLGHLERLEQASLSNPDFIMRATRDLTRRIVLFEIFELDIRVKDPRDIARRICGEEIPEAELAAALSVRLDEQRRTQEFFAQERAEWSESLQVQLGGFAAPGGERVLPPVNDGTLGLVRADRELTPTSAGQLLVRNIEVWGEGVITLPPQPPPTPPKPEEKKKPPEEEPRRRIWLE